MGLSWWHILIVIAAFVVLFGAGRISGLMADIAKGLKSFNSAMKDDEDPETKLIEDKSPKRASRRNRIGEKEKLRAGKAA